jgi:nucleoside-diphosphate-sugar epimerase
LLSPTTGDGSQKVSLTNSEDVASLLACVLNDEASAAEQTYFNCGTDRLITYDEVARMCAKAAGVPEPNVVHYDDASLGKGKFPFRPTDFYVSPTAAMEKLGWGGSKCGLEDDLEWYFEGYLARGGASREMTFVEDEALFAVA